ncbi:hypothetical protein LTR84_010278 [Exophiala bonariae]|uniref:Fungal-type protein kinase domain-containing protein n=1 Tax=Exophiala bonariae TaxID=1690606 RepID=A0AAV9MTY6_9EURO|nr:hypothetical protein LTR84_010278 [Exophiala bonariae]
MTEPNAGSSHRPGKFKDISDLADPTPKDQPTLATRSNHPRPEPKPLVYHPISERKLSVRHIIHVHDNNHTSRIHDRIMLVIRHNSGTSFTCLTLCTHGDDVVDEDHSFDHAKLTTEATHQASVEQPDGYFRLCISLAWGGVERTPKPSAYINMQELWQIEYVEGVKFAILGQASYKHWPTARERIIDIFRKTMLMTPEERSPSISSDRPIEIGSVSSDSGSKATGKRRSSTAVDRTRDSKRLTDKDARMHEREDGLSKVTTITKGLFGTEKKVTTYERSSDRKSKRP